LAWVITIFEFFTMKLLPLPILNFKVAGGLLEAPFGMVAVLTFPPKLPVAAAPPPLEL
jgi:hypothetical protein